MDPPLIADLPRTPRLSVDELNTTQLLSAMRGKKPIAASLTMSDSSMSMRITTKTSTWRKFCRSVENDVLRQLSTTGRGGTKGANLCTAGHRLSGHGWPRDAPPAADVGED